MSKFYQIMDKLGYKKEDWLSYTNEHRIILQNGLTEIVAIDLEDGNFGIHYYDSNSFEDVKFLFNGPLEKLEGFVKEVEKTYC